MEYFKDDLELKETMRKLELVGEEVFTQNTIQHFPCEYLPEGLDGETYIKIFRKKMACIRYEFWKILDRTGGKSDDPET